MSSFSCAEILAGQAPQDTPVTLKGWVRTRRDSKAGISFVHLSDGSGFHPVQVVAPSTLDNYTDEVLHLTAGCAVIATGTIVPSPAKGQPFEMQASRVEVIGWVEERALGRAKSRFYFATGIHPVTGKHYRLEGSTDFDERVNVVGDFHIDPMTSRQHLGLDGR